MGRAGSVLRFVSCTAMIASLGALVAAKPVAGATTHHTSINQPTKSGAWFASNAPPPTTFVDGTPFSAESTYLNGTSCSSASFCVAVGAVQGDDNPPQGYSIPGTFPLAETSVNGGAWQASVLPLPASYEGGYFAILFSVSCGIDGSCAAVGLYEDTNSGLYIPLLETLTNGTWTATAGASPVPPNEFGRGSVTSVSCAPGTTSCVAVGWFNGPNSDPYPTLIYDLTDSGWQLEPQAPLPSNANGTNILLSQVSCPALGSCVIVGNYNDNYSPTASEGFILTQTASGWSVQETPLPPEANPEPGGAGLNVMAAVDCLAPGDCQAAGAFINASGNAKSMFLTLTGNTWVATEAPSAPGIGDWESNVTSMSCTSDTSCVAVGFATNPTYTVTDGLMYTESSTGWTAAITGSESDVSSSSMRTTANTSVHPSRARGVLNGVSCLSAKFCRAAGKQGKHALIEELGRK